MNTSKIVNSTDLKEFNFYADGHIYRGATTPTGLFKLVAEYNATCRTEAFLLALELEQLGTLSMVSVEGNGARRVWTDIRALISPITPKLRMPPLPPVEESAEADA